MVSEAATIHSPEECLFTFCQQELADLLGDFQKDVGHQGVLRGHDYRAALDRIPAWLRAHRNRAILLSSAMLQQDGPLAMMLELPENATEAVKTFYQMCASRLDRLVARLNQDLAAQGLPPVTYVHGGADGRFTFSIGFSVW